MGDLLEVLADYEGIIGVLLGFFANEIIKRVGKIYYYFDVCEEKCYMPDGIGGSEKTEKVKSESTQFDLKFSLCNSRQYTQIFRDIKLLAITESKEKVTLEVIESGKRESLTSINLSSRELIEFECIAYPVQCEKEKLREKIKEVYFIARNEKGRKIKKKIKCFKGAN